MNAQKIYSVVFSPTHTSKRVAKNIAKALGASLGVPVASIDLTHEAAPDLQLSAEDIAVVALPVYGGNCPPLALERLAPLKGSQTPVVVVNVYGNRAFERAVCQLSEQLTRNGFLPIAAAAFIGEHSYSTEQYPIAAGRPDASDIMKATAFGKEVGEKLKSGHLEAIDPTRLEDRPSSPESIKGFIAAIGEMKAQRAVLSPEELAQASIPHTDKFTCNGCGHCVDICPTHAISADTLQTDPACCIHCCACVKECPTNAKIFKSPYSLPLCRYFSVRKEPITLL